MYIFHDTMAYYGMPLTGLILNSLVGNVIAYFGNDEQKEEFLPRTARGEILFCLLYTEPDAGSDLASVRTRADEAGDYFIINGSKIFTSLGHEAHYGLMAARTDQEAPKRRGISLFIVPLDSEGVSVNRLYTMGDGLVGEESFSDVRVHRKYMIGEKNQGWTILNMALGLERGNVASFAAQGKRCFHELIEEVRRRKLDMDPVTCQQIAQMEIELEVTDLMNWHINSLLSRGEMPITEAAMTKLYSSEMMKRLANTSVNILGFCGLLKRGSEGAVLGGLLEYLYQIATMLTVGAGSTEIMEQLIARSGLGLPTFS
jgi:alkylation response protein AidB-like acyl-CoA dehydrogenase